MDTRGELEQPKGEGFQEDQDSPTLNAAIIKENGYWPLTRKSLDTKHSAYACIGKEESFLSFLEKKKKETKSVKRFSSNPASTCKQMLVRVQEQNSTCQNSLFWTIFHKLLLT